MAIRVVFGYEIGEAVKWYFHSSFEVMGKIMSCVQHVKHPKMLEVMKY